MIAHDNKIYYNKRNEPFYDPEWEAAEKANEDKKYYWFETKGGRYIKLYKPSLAKLVAIRTGAKLTEVKTK